MSLDLAAYTSRLQTAATEFVSSDANISALQLSHGAASSQGYSSSAALVRGIGQSLTFGTLDGWLAFASSPFNDKNLTENYNDARHITATMMRENSTSMLVGNAIGILPMGFAGVLYRGAAGALAFGVLPFFSVAASQKLAR